jgi:hypothetical protein
VALGQVALEKQDTHGIQIHAGTDLGRLAHEFPNQRLFGRLMYVIDHHQTSILDHRKALSEFVHASIHAGRGIEQDKIETIHAGNDRSDLAFRIGFGRIRDAFANSFRTCMNHVLCFKPRPVADFE